MRLSGPKVLTLVAWAVSSTVLAGCGADAAQPVTSGQPAISAVTVGSDSSVEGVLIANIYAAAVRGTGVPVAVDSGLRDRAAVVTALDAGSVTLAPDYTTALLRYFNPADATAGAQSDSDDSDSDAVFAELNKSLPEGLAVSDYALAEGSSPEDGYVVPLFRKGALSDAGVKALDVVAGELTTADLADMVSKVRGGKTSSDVAADWSNNHGV